MPELMTLKETARYLRIKNATLYRLAQKGKIPVSKVGGLWRFRKSKIDTWLDENDVSRKKKKENERN